MGKRDIMIGGHSSPVMECTQESSPKTIDQENQVTQFPKDRLARPISSVPNPNFKVRLQHLDPDNPSDTDDSCTPKLMNESNQNMIKELQSNVDELYQHKQHMRMQISPDLLITAQGCNAISTSLAPLAQDDPIKCNEQSLPHQTSNHIVSDVFPPDEGLDSPMSIPPGLLKQCSVRLERLDLEKFMPNKNIEEVQPSITNLSSSISTVDADIGIPLAHSLTSTGSCVNAQSNNDEPDENSIDKLFEDIYTITGCVNTQPFDNEIAYNNASELLQASTSYVDQWNESLEHPDMTESLDSSTGATTAADFSSSQLTDCFSSQLTSLISAASQSVINENDSLPFPPNDSTCKAIDDQSYHSAEEQTDVTNLSVPRTIDEQEAGSGQAVLNDKTWVLKELRVLVQPLSQDQVASLTQRLQLINHSHASVMDEESVTSCHSDADFNSYASPDSESAIAGTSSEVELRDPQNILPTSQNSENSFTPPAKIKHASNWPTRIVERTPVALSVPSHLTDNQSFPNTIGVNADDELHKTVSVPDWARVPSDHSEETAMSIDKPSLTEKSHSSHFPVITSSSSGTPSEVKSEPVSQNRPADNKDLGHQRDSMHCTCMEETDCRPSAEGICRSAVRGTRIPVEASPVGESCRQQQQRLCGDDLLDCNLGMRLVQLDGSPESSSSESDVETAKTVVKTFNEPMGLFVSSKMSAPVAMNKHQGGSTVPKGKSVRSVVPASMGQSDVSLSMQPKVSPSPGQTAQDTSGSNQSKVSYTNSAGTSTKQTRAPISVQTATTRSIRTSRASVSRKQSIKSKNTRLYQNGLMCYNPSSSNQEHNCNTHLSDADLKRVCDADREEIAGCLLTELVESVHCKYNHRSCSNSYCRMGLTKYKLPVYPGKVRDFPSDNMKDDRTQIAYETILDIREKISVAHTSRGSPISRGSSVVSRALKGHSARSTSTQRHSTQRAQPRSLILKAEKHQVKPRTAQQIAADAIADSDDAVCILMSQMVSRVVCDRNHRSCAQLTGCDRPGNNVYLYPEERAVTPVTNDSNLARLESDDITVIAGDLLHEMINWVSCQTDHVPSRMESCTATKCNIYMNISKPVEPLKSKKSTGRLRNSWNRSPNIAKKNSRRSETGQKRVSKSPRKPVLSSRKTNKLIKAERWSDLETDQEQEFSNTADSDSGDEMVTRSPLPRRHSLSTSSSAAKGRSTSSATVSGLSVKGEKTADRLAGQAPGVKLEGGGAETNQPTDSKGVAVLPDLAVDVVLAQTSSDEEDITEPDSAGETSLSRRKTLRRKKKPNLSKEERDKQRERLIANRRATLKYMGTPRSLVLAQLVQEEAQKQCAEILLPKNLPRYVPEAPPVRPFLFPLELRLSQSDIADIVNQVFTPDSVPAGLDPQSLINEMCEVQTSAVMPDCQLLYQLCMFINTMTAEPLPLYKLLRYTVAKYSHSDAIRCPLPSCSSAVFDNWGQVGTHLLLHLPPVYRHLMGESFRCCLCWRGFPTPYHHTHHHLTSHSDSAYTPAVLVGFSSSELTKLWSSPHYTNMVFTDWAVSMSASKREAVADYMDMVIGEPLPPPSLSLLPNDPCYEETLADGQQSTPSLEDSQHGAAVDSAMDVLPDSETTQSGHSEANQGEHSEANQGVLSTKNDNPDASSIDANCCTENQKSFDMYTLSEITNIHMDEGVEHTLYLKDPDLPEQSEDVVVHGDIDSEDGDTPLEHTADTVPGLLVQETKVERTAPVMPSYICWYCARPFIGRSVFYIHLLQEAMAIPAKGVLSGCIFTDVGDTATCELCDVEVPVLQLESHISTYHPEQAIENTNDSGSYAKEEKQCPFSACNEVFHYWSDLGNHVINTHTPPHLRSMLRHRCTACNEVFLTYYHSRSHWEQRLTTCAPGSEATAVESFTAHNLPEEYMTEDHMCSHDVTLVKHKQFTFCSSYMSSHHVMCFVCHKLFKCDAVDLEKESIDEAIQSLQHDLSTHLAVSHQIMLSTGVEINEDDSSSADEIADEGSDMAYDHDTEVEDEPAAAEPEVVLSKQVLTPTTTVVKLVSVLKGDTPKVEPKYCGIHTSIKYATKPEKHCVRCKTIKNWIDLVDRCSEYTYTMNFTTDSLNSYCKLHKNGIIAVHNFHKHFSYCVECSTVQGSVSVSPNCYCDDHGPFIQLKSSVKICGTCSKPCKPYPSETRDVRAEIVEGNVKLENKSLVPSSGSTLSPTNVCQDDMMNANGGQLKGAILTSQICNLHNSTPLHLCQGVNGVQMLVCRKCRALGYKQSSGTRNLNGHLACASHPLSVVCAIPGTSSVYCTSCASVELSSDIFCKFHVNASLVYSSCGKVVIACAYCKEFPFYFGDNEVSVSAPKPDKFCGIHPTSNITTLGVDGTGKVQLYCNSCRFQSSSATLSPPMKEVQTPTPHSIPSDISSQDLALCFSLFQQEETANKDIASASLHDVQMASSGIQTCRYVQDCDRLIDEHSELIQQTKPTDRGQRRVRNTVGKTTATGSGTKWKINKDDKWKKGQYFQCKYCPQNLNSYRHYDAHMRDVHRATRLPPIYPCIVCCYVTACSESFDDHIKTHSSANGLRCMGCGFTVSTLKKLSQHFLQGCQDHPANAAMQRCKICDFKTGDVQVLEKHLATHSKRKVTSSKVSRRPSSAASNQSDKNSIISAISSSDNVQTDAMPDNGAIKTVENGLHNSEQSAEKVSDSTKWGSGHIYYCKLSKQCYHASSSQEDHMKHVKRQHKDEAVRKLIPCETCFFVADRRTTADKHKLLHSSQSSVQCDRCYHLAADSQQMTSHLRFCQAKKTKVKKIKSVIQEMGDNHICACRHCSYTTFSQIDFHTHCLEEHQLRISRLFPCTKCPYVADQKVSIRSHMEAHAVPNPLKCGRCYYLAAFLPGFGIHQGRNPFCKRFTDENPDDNKVVRKQVMWQKNHVFKCRHCELRLTSRHQYKTHMRSSHTDKPIKLMYPCPQCSFITDQLPMSKLHEVKHGSGNLLTCRKCHETFEQPLALYKHRKQCKIKPEAAMSTNKEFGNLKVLWTKSHVYICQHCPYLIVSIKDFRSHMRRYHKEESDDIFPCTKCSYVTSQANGIASHEEFHKLNDPVKCPQCSFLCSTEEELREHRSATCLPAWEHSGLRHIPASHIPLADWRVDHRFSCKECCSFILSGTDYDLHMQHKHGIAVNHGLFPCKACSFVTDDTVEYVQHLHDHLISKLHKCRRCHYSCLKAAGLREHQKVCSPHVLLDSTSALVSAYKKPRNTCPSGDISGNTDAEISQKDLANSPIDTTTIETVFSTNKKPHKTSSSSKGRSALGQWTDEHKYICRYCPFIITKDEEYSSHMNEMHADQPMRSLYPCSSCYYATDLIFLYENHIDLHKNESSVKCVSCGFLSTSRKGISRHATGSYCPATSIEVMGVTIQVKDPPAPWKCTHRFHCKHCTAVITTLEAYEPHMKQEHPDEVLKELFPCSQCCFVAESWVLARHHTRCHSEDNPYKCKTCGYLTMGSMAFRSHKTKGYCYEDEDPASPWTSRNRFHCKYCTAVITTLEAYEPHMKQEHPDEVLKELFPCKQCCFVAESLVNIQWHLRHHAEENPYKCSTCGYLSMSQKTFRSHTSKGNCYEATGDEWSKENFFYCRYCYFMVQSTKQYREHMSSKHASKGVQTLHPCPDCCYVTDFTSTNKYHTECHTMNALFKCVTCGFLALSEDKLKVHVRNLACPAAKLKSASRPSGRAARSSSCISSEESSSTNKERLKGKKDEQEMFTSDAGDSESASYLSTPCRDRRKRLCPNVAEAVLSSNGHQFQLEMEPSAKQIPKESVDDDSILIKPLASPETILEKRARPETFHIEELNDLFSFDAKGQSKAEKEHSDLEDTDSTKPLGAKEGNSHCRMSRLASMKQLPNTNQTADTSADDDSNVLINPLFLSPRTLSETWALPQTTHIESSVKQLSPDVDGSILSSPYLDMTPEESSLLADNRESLEGDGFKQTGSSLPVSSSVELASAKKQTSAESSMPKTLNLATPVSKSASALSHSSVSEDDQKTPQRRRSNRVRSCNRESSQLEKETSLSRRMPQDLRKTKRSQKRTVSGTSSLTTSDEAVVKSDELSKLENALENHSIESRKASKRPRTNEKMADKSRSKNSPVAEDQRNAVKTLSTKVSSKRISNGKSSLRSKSKEVTSPPSSHRNSQTRTSSADEADKTPTQVKSILSSKGRKKKIDLDEYLKRTADSNVLLTAKAQTKQRKKTDLDEYLKQATDSNVLLTAKGITLEDESFTKSHNMTVDDRIDVSAFMTRQIVDEAKTRQTEKAVTDSHSTVHMNSATSASQNVTNSSAAGTAPQFSSSAELTQHCNSLELRCERCALIFIGLEDIIDHANVHDSHEFSSCYACGQDVLARYINLHIITHHLQMKYPDYLKWCSLMNRRSLSTGDSLSEKKVSSQQDEDSKTPTGTSSSSTSNSQRNELNVPLAEPTTPPAECELDRAGLGNTDIDIPADHGTDINRDKPVEHGKDVSRDKPADHGTDINRDKPVEHGTDVSRDKPVEHGTDVNRDKLVDHGTDINRDKPVEHGTDVSRDKPVEHGTDVSRSKPVEHGTDINRDKPTDHKKVSLSTLPHRVPTYIRYSTSTSAGSCQTNDQQDTKQPQPSRLHSERRVSPQHVGYCPRDGHVDDVRHGTRQRHVRFPDSPSRRRGGSRPFPEKNTRRGSDHSASGYGSHDDSPYHRHTGRVSFDNRWKQNRDDRQVNRHRTPRDACETGPRSYHQQRIRSHDETGHQNAWQVPYSTQHSHGDSEYGVTKQGRYGHRHSDSHIKADRRDESTDLNSRTHYSSRRSCTDIDRKTDTLWDERQGTCHPNYDSQSRQHHHQARATYPDNVIYCSPGDERLLQSHHTEVRYVDGTKGYFPTDRHTQHYSRGNGNNDDYQVAYNNECRIEHGPRYAAMGPDNLRSREKRTSHDVDRQLTDRKQFNEAEQRRSKSHTVTGPTASRPQDVTPNKRNTDSNSRRSTDCRNNGRMPTRSSHSSERRSTKAQTNYGDVNESKKSSDRGRANRAPRGTEQLSSGRSKRLHSDDKTDKCSVKRSRQNDDECGEIVMTTHDGQIVRLKSRQGGELELA